MTKVNTQTTPTGIVFSIRTARPLGLDTVRRAVFRAGFVCNDAKLVMTGRNTRAVLAVLSFTRHLSVDNTINGIDVKLGKSAERGMGSRLVADLEHLASDLDATICNGEGEVLTLIALNAIAAEIDAVAVPTITRRAKPVVITKLDGLSFRTKHTNARGNVVLDNFFDVPAEDYCSGWDTGRRAAAELLAVIKAEPRNGYPMFGLRLSDLLPDVGKALADCATGNTPDRKGAALGFLSVLDAAINFAVHNADMQAYVQRELDRSEVRRLQSIEREAAERAEFVQRMQAARKAKRDAKAVAA